jgi:hypothetical protein
MTPKERSELARALAAIELPHPMLERRLIRRRRFGLVVMIGACLVLAPWIAWLMFELPMDFTARHWRGVWVGLDIVELAAFAATAWAAWFQRQIVILLMILTGTLLVCDAWFDVALEFGTHGFTSSVVLALLVELPVAFLLFNGARRLVRLTVHGVMRLQGVAGPLPHLWQIPLFADGLAEALPYRRRAATPEGRSASELGPLPRVRPLAPAPAFDLDGVRRPGVPCAPRRRGSALGHQRR